MPSRNAMYEQNMRDKGYSKLTFWVPTKCQDEFKLMAAICRENPDMIPSTVRSLTTGRMKGINQ